MSTTPPGRTDDLKTLAHARFGDLTEAEVKLLRAAPKGDMAWCGPSAGKENPANDPRRADKSEGNPGWGPEREIRADLIRWLCIDRQAAAVVDPRGIQVYAAKIVGGLGLSFATVTFPLGLMRCRLTDDAYFYGAHIPSLNMAGSRTRSLAADGIHVTGSLFLRDGFNAEGEVRLLGAQIGGHLDCSGSKFEELEAQEATIKCGFVWRAIQRPEVATLGLINASAGAIADDQASWPKKQCCP